FFRTPKPGKLFYYRIEKPPHIHNISLIQAGHHLNPEQDPLPEWLHFNAQSGELFGAPTEKKIYFIQVAALLQSPYGQPAKTYEDIFVIEVVDLPAYLQQSDDSFLHQQQSGSKDLAIYQCRIELKNAVSKIAD